MSGPANSSLVETRALTKRFGDFTAVDRVDLAIARAEIHALLGENGAGKSTFVKMLYGLLQPTAGEIVWEGQPIVHAGPSEARARGIGMVFQHFSLFENLTVAENVALSMPPRPLAGIADEVADVSRRYGLPLEPQREVWRLSVGERQRIEIVRCLLQDPKLLILDEPTSVLTPQEAERLFETLERLRAEGRAILYISHKLDEVRRLCERATILRQAKKVATCNPRDETPASLARMMVGSDVGDVRPAPAHGLGPERLVVRGLSLTPDDPHGTALADVTLAVRGGEVVGIAGVAGNGQDELFAALSGEVLAERPDIVLIDGAPVGRTDIGGRRARKAAFVPEERLGHAAAPRMVLSDNVLLTRHGERDIAGAGLVRRSRMLDLVDAVTKAFDVRKARRDPEARSLSGGNLQKFVVGREMLREPGVLVVSQPTWGVDAGAARQIRQALVDLAARGAAVVVISQDLDELFAISDRIAVLYHGRLSAPRPARETTREELGLLMGGVGIENLAHSLPVAEVA